MGLCMSVDGAREPIVPSRRVEQRKVVAAARGHAG